MPVTDLCTLAQVKQWLPTPPASSDDGLLSVLISQTSAAILSDIQRQPVFAQTITDLYDASGQQRLMLRRYPVLSVSSVVLGTLTTIMPANAQQFNSGWVLQPWDGFLPGKPQLLDLRNWSYSVWGGSYWSSWSGGLLAVSVTYKVGYQIQNEPATIPAATPFAINVQQLNGPWVQDNGVTFAATGVALTPVAPGIVPSTGQYIAPLVNDGGTYQFSAADAGKGVLLTYSYVPTPLNQAAVEVVSEAYRYRQRIGERSHTVPGPMTSSFDLSRFTAAVKWMTQPYRQVAPIQ